MEAVEAGKELERVFVQDGINNDLIKNLKKLLGEKKIIYSKVPLQKLQRLTPKNHQGVVAFISSIDYYSLDQMIPSLFEEGKVPLLMMLDRITDVRNFGAIARSAECFGCHALIIPVTGNAPVNDDAVKTSAGALHRIAVCREKNLNETASFLRESGIQIIACTEKSQKSLSEADLKIPTAFILGSEEDGVSSSLMKTADQKVKIPMEGKISSLNVSVAAGIVLYECTRQREKT